MSRNRLHNAIDAATWAAFCILLAGCSGQMPNVVMDTPTGVTPIYTPSPAMPSGMVGPPPSLDNPTLPPAQAPNDNRSGNYAGTAVPQETGGGICIDTRQVTNFRVLGNAVSFGQFQGTIAPDGGLQMADGQDWIVGRFVGATFRGQLNLYGRFGSPGCTYAFSLDRVSS